MEAFLFKMYVSFKDGVKVLEKILQCPKCVLLIFGKERATKQQNRVNILSFIYLFSLTAL